MIDGQREIGRVESITIGPEDHGIFSLYIHIRFAGSGQGYGGICLDEYDEATKKRRGSAYGCEVLRQVHTFFGLQSMGSLARANGQTVEVERDGGCNTLIQRIRRLPVDGGAVLDFKAIAAEMGVG